MDNPSQSTPINNSDDELSLPPVVDDQQHMQSQVAPIAPIDSQSPDTPASAQPLIPMPTEANDDDLIEKEWVEKAKQIVDHTSTDPYQQQKELSKVKADYMKKRYNKDIKVSDS